jgi:murein L,D-transpeptidase YcbB/YkuD
MIAAATASGLSCGSLASAQSVAPIAASQAPQPLSSLPAQLTVGADVNAAYDTYHIRPIWVRNGVVSPAAEQLTAILRRATFDGLAQGPELASQVDATIAKVRASPLAAADADRVLSTAWVRYVQALRRPTSGMIYAYAALKPQGTQTDEILLTTAAASSLSEYVTATSELNPVYGALRDAAWAEAQANGNLTPDPRLLANLDRVRSIPARGRFALVDSGDQRLTLFENGQPVDSMKVIVGTKELPTPLIASMIYYVTYNPYWHAPDHLVRKTIAPTFLKQGVKYLKSHGYHVVDAWSEKPAELDPTGVDWKGAAAGTAHLLVQQDPGPLNSMGNLKFAFDNPEGIYLHDTPNKDLFGKDVRFLSNGCVRLEDAQRFGRWLLGQDPVAPSSIPETAVQLPKPVPIVLTYLTAQVVDGKVTYLPDVYGWDTAAPSQFASAN